MSLSLVITQWDNITFAVPILVDINTPLTTALFSIFIAEFLISLTGLAIINYFAYFVYNYSIFHKNLAKLLILSVVCYHFGLVARWYLIMVQIKWITDLKTFWFLISGILRMETFGVCLSCVPVIAIERTFATYFIMDYESKNRSWVVAVSFLFSLIYTQFFVIPVCFCGYNLKYILFWVISWSMLGITLLLYLYKFNYKELEKIKFKYIGISKFKIYEYTLGKKYQLEENIKITKGLIVMGFMLSVLISLILVILSIPSLSTPSESDTQIILATYDLWIAIASISIPSMCLFFLKADKKLFRKGKQANALKKSSSVDETKEYFNQLKASWK